MKKPRKSLIQSIRREMPPPKQVMKAAKNVRKADLAGRKAKHRKKEME